MSDKWLPGAPCALHRECQELQMQPAWKQRRERTEEIEITKKWLLFLPCEIQDICNERFIDKPEAKSQSKVLNIWPYTLPMFDA